MKVGIVGLGLIGGSFARAYSQAGHEVYIYDIDKTVTKHVIDEGAARAELKSDMIKDCDLILICTYPKVAVKYLEENADNFGTKVVVIDCCGTKRVVVENGMKLAKEHGFTYVGGHPMAGTHFSGFDYSRANMYENAPMVIVPPEGSDEALLDRVRELLEPAGFGVYTITTAEEHDEIIAFTSQLAHVVSNAYVKSPSAKVHKGMSAGSYKDLTRVAWLNPGMWAELFLDNRENLIREIDSLIVSLGEYRDAMVDEDRERLEKLLLDGKLRKEEIDG